MSNKLTSERLAEIREADKACDSRGFAQFTDAECHREELLAELDRTRPEWIRTDAGQHHYDRYFHVAGTTPSSLVPVWLGRGKFDSDWGRWIDANTGKPFPVGTEITHWLRQLTPVELIGQPEV